MEQEALFDADPPPAEPPVSAGRRRTQRQRAAIEHGTHPLTAALGVHLPLHTEQGRTCGNCRFRESVPAISGKEYPKCTYTDSRGAPVHVTRGPGTDIRAWWPGCHHHEKEEQWPTHSTRPLRNWPQ